MTVMQKCRRVVNHSTPAPIIQLSNSYDFGSLFIFSLLFIYIYINHFPYFFSFFFFFSLILFLHPFSPR